MFLLLFLSFVCSTSRCYELRAAQEFVQKSQAFPFQRENISSWFSARFSLSFSSDVHISLFGFKVKPQQPAEHGTFLQSAAVMIHAWRLRPAAWFHLSSSSTQWNSFRGFPTCDDSSILTSTVCQCSVDTPSFVPWMHSHTERHVFTELYASKHWHSLI